MSVIEIPDPLPIFADVQFGEVVVPFTITYCKDEEIVICLGQEAGRLREKYYGNKVYMRGLIEFTNF